MTYCNGCTGTCCTGVGSDPCTCTDNETSDERRARLTDEWDEALSEVAEQRQLLKQARQTAREREAEWQRAIRKAERIEAEWAAAQDED